jgi:hypothetical protein
MILLRELTNFVRELTKEEKLKQINMKKISLWPRLSKNLLKSSLVKNSPTSEMLFFGNLRLRVMWKGLN